MEALGCMSLAADLGLTFGTRARVVKSAALGILKWKGMGRKLSKEEARALYVECVKKYIDV